MINLKFRGKCIKTGNWVYGGGIDSQRDTPIIINHGERYHVDAKSVGVSSGVTDKDGIEAYQGGIVKMYRQDMYSHGHRESTVHKFKYSGDGSYTCIGEMQDIRTVLWIKGALMLHCKDGASGHSKSFNALANPGESFEIIGNTTDNKDMVN